MKLTRKDIEKMDSEYRDLLEQFLAHTYKPLRILRQITAHEMALRRIEQAGYKMISVPQLFCELQRDWQREETVPAFMNLFIETESTAGIRFSYDRTE